MISNEVIRLISVSDSPELTEEFRAIYEEAFPPDERREWTQMLELLNNPNFRLDGIYHQGKLIGMLSIWNLNEFRFIEHFAIRASERKKGFGTLVIQQMTSRITSTIILEVEDSSTDLAQQRIRFYERCGFWVCKSEYYQPPYSVEKSKVKMLLMSYPEKILEGHFSKIKSMIYRSVYGLDV